MKIYSYVFFFVVLPLTLRSMIRFELIFVYCVRKRHPTNIILFAVEIQLSKCHLLKDYSFPH